MKKPAQMPIKPTRVIPFFTALFLCQTIAQAATVYVSSTGSDANSYAAAQNPATPWATITHALAINAVTQAPTSGLQCGDTIMGVPTGVFVSGDSNIGSGGGLPVFPGGCDKVTTIQSSKLANFSPPGYRTNPATDAANYFQINFTGSPFNAQAEVRGNSVPSWNCTYDTPPVTIANPGVFTTHCGAGLRGGLANGDQVEFEVGTQNVAGVGFPSVTIPAPLVFQQKYYVVNCSVSPGCGAQGGTYSVAATPGGTPIQITACDANCQIFTYITKPVAVAIGTPCTFTSPEVFTIITNGVPVVLAVAGAQSYGTFPTTTPTQLALDTIYYPVNMIGKVFQLATTPGGTGLACSTVGTGQLSIANATVPGKWAFRGLELAPSGGATLGYLLQMGGGTELSGVVGIPSNFEVDRVYMHGNDTIALGQFQNLARCISENGIRIYVHDSYCSGATYSEAQAVAGTQSQGAAYINNFFEGATENTICGGQDPSGGLPCQHHQFIGNYFYHPPTWKYTTAIGAPTGACLYDTYDPLRSGGEWYQDIGPQVNVNVGGGDSAHFTVTQVAGVITAITLTGGGESYANGTYTTGFIAGAGTGATASLTASGGVITSGVVTAGGSGYTPPQLYQCNNSFAWVTSAGTPQITNISFKDQAEHKNGRDFLYLGNVFRYTIVGGQWEVFNNSNESNDSGPGAANDTIIIQNNAIYDSYIFATRSSRCLATIYMPCIYAPGSHVTKNNLFVVNPLACGVVNVLGPTCQIIPAQDTWGQFNASFPLQGFVWQHNTMWSPDGCCTLIPAFGVRKMSTYYGNQYSGAFTIIDHAYYADNLNIGDFAGDTFSSGASISHYFTNSVFTNNVQREGTSGAYGTVGTGNTWLNVAFPANLAAVKFKNGSGTPAGDYHLDPTSNFSAASGCVALCSSDGTDVGADIDAIMQATSGALSGTPPWSSTVSVGSRKVVVRYTAPTAEIYTATIYSAPVRIVANRVATLPDSDANAISIGSRREVPLTGLAAVPTHYWYSVANPSGSVIMLGDFITRAVSAAPVKSYEQFGAATALTSADDKALTVNPTTCTAATQQLVPVNGNAIRYVAPTANPALVSMRIAP